MKVFNNYEELATSALRRDALAIAGAALEGVDVSRITNEKILLNGETLQINSDVYDLSRYERVFVLGLGKCALSACRVLEEKLFDMLEGGIVYATNSENVCTFQKLECLQGSHPFPSEENVSASRKIANLLDSLEESDLLIVVVSGGASTLLCLPNGAGTCVEEKRIIETLMAKGADITEINIVRKHLSSLRGGNIAASAYPATVLGLIYSDVPGDDLATVASGPTVKDETTRDDARAVLAKYSLKSATNDFLRETPKDDNFFSRTYNTLVLSNADALHQAEYSARRLGYTTHIVTATLAGEAAVVGKDIASVLGEYAPKTCLLYGGETTVSLEGEAGTGGRNQELALGALEFLPEDGLLLSLATDGRDNTDAAGALVDGRVRHASRTEGVALAPYLARHNSYEFFTKVGGHIYTGPTGSNVSDIIVALRD